MEIKIIKPNVYKSVIFSILILLSSCNKYDISLTGDNELSLTKNKFEFNFFDENKENMIDINSFSHMDKSSLTRLQMNNLLIKEINKEFDSNLNYSDGFKNLELNSFEEISDYLIQNNILDNKDLKLLKSFSYRLNKLNIDDAIEHFENDVFSSYSDAQKIQKFEYLVNIVKLFEYHHDYFSSNSLDKNCFSASIALAFATAALVAACNPASVTVSVGTACYIAAANFIRASIVIGLECGEK